MAYIAVPTVATGDMWTAAQHNTYVRDNFAAGVPDLFTAKGDLAVATAANVAGVLAVGVNGTRLTADSTQSTGLIWRSAPACYAYYGIGTLTLGVSGQVIPFDTVSFDTDSCFTTGASAKFTAPVTSIYLATLGLSIYRSSAGAGKIGALLYKNGVGVSGMGVGNGSYADYWATGAGVKWFSGQVALSLTAGDYIQWYVSDNESSPATTLYFATTAIGIL